MVTSTTVTVIQMFAMLDEQNFREAFIILLLLNDVIPAYIVQVFIFLKIFLMQATKEENKINASLDINI